MANNVRIGVGVKDDASGPIDRIKHKFETLGSSSGFKSLVTGVGLGIGQAAFNSLGMAAGAAADFIGQSIDASRDLNESLSKSRVIFGGAAGDIEAFGDKAAESMGMSKQAAIEAAATFGNFFRGLGQGETEAANSSKAIVKLAGDLASFNNLDPTDVLQKLRSGLTGEAEPLRSVGVFLTEAKVKAKAMQLGLGDAHGELTEGEKVLARYQLILDETTTAQGDFARTADGLANSQRTANAKLTDAQAKLGKTFEPIALGVTEVQIAFAELLAGTSPLQRALSGVSGGMDNLSDEMTTTKESTTGLSGAVGRISSSLRTSKQRADDAREAMQKLRDEIVDDANAIIEGYYDPIEMRQQIAENNAEIRANRAKLRSKDTTSAEKRDAHSVITQAQEDNDKLAIALLATGQMTEKEHEALLKRVDKSIAHTTGRAKAYFIALRKEIERLDGMKASIQIIAKIRQQGIGASIHKDEKFGQHGGIFPAGATLQVGEVAQETAHLLPGGGAVITPNTGVGRNGNTGIAMAGGGINLTVNFNSVVPATQADAARIARDIGPAIANHLRDRGLIPR